jgi:hypothetical protein
MDVVAAVAGVSRMLGQLAEGPYLTTFGAPEVIPISKSEQVGQTGRVVREPLEKVLNCQCLGHVASPMPVNIGELSTYVNFTHA